MESKEFKRVLHNLHLENMSFSPKIQKRIITDANDNEKISPALIKEMLAYDKV
ncbi:Zn-dependent hydrolase [Ornithinibacillus sp. 4-3]|uniref:Zn-dependent hydrolase n=1 Tax=Ornithinibacillus sp. 4-3 TaxID=3231488 RepID=A0AB39HN92_9BACI